MRLKSKTMATLLVAVLIAIAGVMTALAADDTVTLTASVEAATLSITASGGAFGPVTPGTPATGTPLDIVITGEPTWSVDLSADLSETEEFFEAAVDGLTIDGTVADDWESTVLVEVSPSLPLVFTPPAGAAAGGYSATLVIFAEYTPGQ